MTETVLAYLVMGGAEYHHAVRAAVAAHYDGGVVVIQDQKVATRRFGKSTAMAIRAQMDYHPAPVIIEEKPVWNTNRQRNLRHYPGRRWIDKRTRVK